MSRKKSKLPRVLLSPYTYLQVKMNRLQYSKQLTVHNRATITTKRGNEVSRDGDAEDPAVILDTGKSKAIKSAHELN